MPLMLLPLLTLTPWQTPPLRPITFSYNMSGLATLMVRLWGLHNSEGWDEILVYENLCDSVQRGVLKWTFSGQRALCHRNGFEADVGSNNSGNRAAPFEQFTLLHICCRFVSACFPTLCTRRSGLTLLPPKQILFIFLQVIYVLYAVTVRGIY